MVGVVGSISTGSGLDGAAGSSPVIEPATGEEIARVGTASAADVARAQPVPGAAQQEWAALPHTQRAAVLRKAGDLFAEHAEEFSVERS